MPVSWRNYWLFQWLISNSFGIYLTSSQYLPSPWPSIAALALRIIFYYLLGTFPPLIIHIAEIFILHLLSSIFPLNLLLLSVLIFISIPFIAYHLLYIFNPQALDFGELGPPRLMTFQYISIAVPYFVSIKGLFESWGDEEAVRNLQAAVGYVLFSVGFHCAVVNDHMEFFPRRFLA